MSKPEYRDHYSWAICVPVPGFRISEGKRTTIHLYTMFSQFLNENLPPGGRAR